MKIYIKEQLQYCYWNIINSFEVADFQTFKYVAVFDGQVIGFIGFF
jgi:hypothetical protein